MDTTGPDQAGLLEVDIHDLSREGVGIARHQGQVILVPQTVPGDRVRIRPEGLRRRQLQGRVEAILQPSAQRRRPPCILSDHCGGCSLQAMQDTAQQAWKQTMVQETLRRLAAIEPPLRPLLSAEESLGYRNRAIIPLERLDDGRLRAGFYRRGSHRIVNMNHCPVLDPRLDALIAPLKADLEASDWPVDRHGRGLRHLALRIGQRSGELLITLIASSADLPGLESLATSWMQRWPALVGVCLNLQPEPTNVLMGPETRCIAGRAWLEEPFAGLRFRIGSDTFFQVHAPQAERLLPSLREACGDPQGRLIDAYGGIGTFGLPLAAAGWGVDVVEQHPSSLDLARSNAAGNGLEGRVRFHQGSVADHLEALLNGTDPVGAVLVDPPRRGLDPAVLQTLLRHPSPRLAYLSCDPATLARDLRLLTGLQGYRLRWVQPVDFFPNTTHVECLAALERS
ncbi:MAG: 23S rRNA (uracil(1939)-C(5))-methyltransferase RlmD [Synechococcaceae cyanobacterium]|nr:23S rRNA (uracil(1939)-C(5))-methyltransferase RlmD [Synechococcaceae cyanobacterium]